MIYRTVTGLIFALVLSSAHAASITEDLGELNFYQSYETGAIHRGAFQDTFSFSVPRTAIELHAEVNMFGSQIRIVDGFEIWRGDSLVFQANGLTYGIGTYIISDPLQPSYTSDYVSSISGPYRLNVFGTDPFYLGGFYNVRLFVNPNSYIPTVPIPSAAILFFSGLLGLATLKKRPFA